MDILNSEVRGVYMNEHLYIHYQDAFNDYEIEIGTDIVAEWTKEYDDFLYSMAFHEGFGLDIFEEEIEWKELPKLIEYALENYSEEVSHIVV